jgi:hypothetical protein
MGGIYIADWTRRPRGHDPDGRVTKPDIYELGTLTSAVFFLGVFSAPIVILALQARQRRHGSDAGKGMM